MIPLPPLPGSVVSSATLGIGVGMAVLLRSVSLLAGLIRDYRSVESDR